MKNTIILLPLFFAYSLFSQHLNPDAEFSTFSINLVHSDEVSKECQNAVENKILEYIDEFNKREKRAFDVVLNDPGVAYSVTLHIDSLKPVSKGRKVMAWTFFGLGFGCLLVPPAGAYIIYTSLTGVARDMMYMKTEHSDNLRGEDYRVITHMRGYNALFISNDEERKAKQYVKMPKLVYKYTKYLIRKADGYYLSMIKKRQKRT